MTIKSNFNLNYHSKQQPLRGEIFKIFGKGEEPYMGVLMGGLDKPLETMLKKKRFVLEISRFLRFCEIYRFQNL